MKRSKGEESRKDEGKGKERERNQYHRLSYKISREG